MHVISDHIIRQSGGEIIVIGRAGRMIFWISQNHPIIQHQPVHSDAPTF